MSRGSVCGPLGKHLIKCARKHCISGVVLASIKNHAHFIEIVLFLLQKPDNSFERNRRGQSKRIDERPGGNGWKGYAVQSVLNRDLQTAAVGTRQQLWLILIATKPNGADRMNDVSGREIAPGGNHGITNRTTADTPTLFVNFRTTFVWMVPSVPLPLLSRQCAAVTTASVSCSAISPVTNRSVVLPIFVCMGVAMIR